MYINIKIAYINVNILNKCNIRIGLGPSLSYATASVSLSDLLIPINTIKGKNSMDIDDYDDDRCGFLPIYCTVLVPYVHNAVKRYRYSTRTFVYTSTVELYKYILNRYQYIPVSSVETASLP